MYNISGLSSPNKTLITLTNVKRTWTAVDKMTGQPMLLVPQRANTEAPRTLYTADKKSVLLFFGCTTSQGYATRQDFELTYRQPLWNATTKGDTSPAPVVNCKMNLTTHFRFSGKDTLVGTFPTKRNANQPALMVTVCMEEYDRDNYLLYYGSPDKDKASERVFFAKARCERSFWSQRAHTIELECAPGNDYALAVALTIVNEISLRHRISYRKKLGRRLRSIT